MAERVSQWPCAVCTKGCTTNAILCDYCGQWTHYSCESLSESEFNELSDITCGYVCTTCRVDRKGEFDFKKSLQRLTEASREASGAKTRGMDRRSCDRQPYKRMCFSEGCLGPLASLLDNELSSFILDRPTSSGLVKHISTKQSTFIVSPEILDLDQVRLSRVRVAKRRDRARREAACETVRARSLGLLRDGLDPSLLKSMTSSINCSKMMKTTRAVTRCYYVNFFPAKRVLTHTPQKATEIFPPTLLSLSSAARKFQMQQN